MLDTLYAVLRYEKEQLQKILHAPVGVCVCVRRMTATGNGRGRHTEKKEKKLTMKGNTKSTLRFPCFFSASYCSQFYLQFVYKHIKLKRF